MYSSLLSCFPKFRPEERQGKGDACFCNLHCGGGTSRVFLGLTFKEHQIHLPFPQTLSVRPCQYTYQLLHIMLCYPRTTPRHFTSSIQCIVAVHRFGCFATSRNDVVSRYSQSWTSIRNPLKSSTLKNVSMRYYFPADHLVFS